MPSAKGGGEELRHAAFPPRRAGSETPPRADFTNSSLLSRHGRRYSRLHSGNFFGTIAPSVLSSLPPSLNTAYRPNGAAPESAVTRHRRSAWIPGRPLRASPR